MILDICNFNDNRYHEKLLPKVEKGLTVCGTDL